jgi:hypothetical protein
LAADKKWCRQPLALLWVEVFAVQVIIHCGLDKAGSTAIQSHAALFRQWLLDNGIYLPTSGLSFGHRRLFADLDMQNWRPLLEELGRLDQGKFRRCFLSFEGICYFDEEQLALIKDYLADYEVAVLFYLREQAEILQSGYLQQLKSKKHPLSVAHLNFDQSLFGLASRDYSRMLQKFESVFGREAIAVRLYQPGEWRDGSILWDFLEFLGCPPDSQFNPAKQRQNISLDVQAARVLNVFDSYGDNAAGREALVEDLLWLIQKYPGGSSYFLDETAVQQIRSFYRDSNAALAERYGVEFNYRDCDAGSQGVGNGGVSYVSELANLARYPRWKGEPLAGSELTTVLQHRAGWSRFETWGVWSLDDVSQIEFRLPLARFTGLEDSITLTFRGRYFADNTSTRIQVNGHYLEDADLREASVRIPIRLLDENRVVHLELRHHAAISPAALALNSDKRRLAYGLHGLSYQFASLSQTA